MPFLLVLVLISPFWLAWERRLRSGRRIVRHTGGGASLAQRREHRPLPRRRFEDDGAGHARTDQDTLGHIVDMDAHRDPLSKPHPLESRRIDEQFGAVDLRLAESDWPTHAPPPA
jgi:hypothetical protein